MRTAPFLSGTTSWLARTRGKRYDREVYDYCKEGLAHFRFHPANLPERDTFLPLARFDSNS